MNQLLISLRSKSDASRAEAAYKAADKLEKLRNSLTEYMENDSITIDILNRAKKALGIR